VDAHSFNLIVGKANDLTITQNNNQLTIRSTTDVVIVPSTSKKGTVGGLTRGMEVDVYIVADNSAGLGPISGKVNVIVP
jgi:hypothetical protein